MACVKSAAEKIKYACCTETIAKGISTSSHFLHKVTVSMTTVWWLVLPLYSLSFFFHSTPFISAISLFEDPSWPSRFYLPLHHPLSFTFHPWLPLSKALLFERQNEKNQGVNRLQERQCFDGLKMMQHQSVCVWVFFPWQKWDWAGVASISKASIPGYMLGTWRVESHIVLLSAFLC